MIREYLLPTLSLACTVSAHHTSLSALQTGLFLCFMSLTFIHTALGRLPVYLCVYFPP